MTLTRSFLKTYFVVGKIEDNLRQRFANNIENITSTKKCLLIFNKKLYLKA